ncbi:MAG: tetratricopeptide repeat protein, partial [Promethearchaeota archaeon]
MYSQNDELKELIHQGKFEEALEIIDEQLKKFIGLQVNTEASTWKEKCQLVFLKSKIFEIIGNFTQSLTLIDEIMEECKHFEKLSSEVQLMGLFAKTIPLFFLGRIKENAQILKEATQLLDTTKQMEQADLQRYRALISLFSGLNSIYTSDFKKGLPDLQYGLDALQQLKSDDWLVGLGLLFKGMYYSEMGDYQQALGLLKLSADYNQKRGFIYNYILNLGHIANSYCEQGDLINAKKYGLQANNLAKEGENLFVLGYTQRTLGRIFLNMGDLIEAEENFRAAWKTWELNKTLHVYFPISWLGLIHRMRGEPDLAIEYFIFGLEKTRELGYRNAEGWALDFIGELYWEKGDFQEALSYLNEALTVRKELGNKNDITRTLFNLFLVNLELGNLENAKNQLLTLNNLKTDLNNQIIKSRTQLAEALLLMQSRKLIEKGNAQNMLLELLSMNVEERIKILVLLNLFVAEGLRKGIPGIFILTDKSPSEIRDGLKLVIPKIDVYEKKGLLKYVDAYSKSMGIDVEERNSVMIEKPTDLDEIGGAVANLQKKIQKDHKYHKIATHSISTIMTYTDAMSTFRFLQTLTSRNKRMGAISLYCMDHGMFSDSEVQTLKHLMNGIIEFKVDDLKSYLRVEGIGDVRTRGWIEYSHTTK